MDLKKLFKQALQIVWQNPLLWLFGFFSILFANNEFNLIITNFNRINNWIDQLITFNAIKTYFQRTFSNFIPDQTSNPTAVYYLIFIAIIIILFLCLSFFSQIFIISSIKENFETKKNLSISNFWKKNKKNILPVIGMYIAIFLITYGFLIFLGLPFFYKISIPIIVYIIIFLLLSFFISFIAKFAIFFIILDNKKFFIAIKEGFLFFLKNWLLTIKTSAFLFIVFILFGLIFLLIFLGTTIPSSIFLSFFSNLNFPFGFLITIILLATVSGLLFLIISSILSTLQFSIWTLFFLELHHKKTSIYGL